MNTCLECGVPVDEEVSLCDECTQRDIERKILKNQRDFEEIQKLSDRLNSLAEEAKSVDGTSLMGTMTLLHISSEVEEIRRALEVRGYYSSSIS